MAGKIIVALDWMPPKYPDASPRRSLGAAVASRVYPAAAMLDQPIPRRALEKITAALNGMKQKKMLRA